ncbi:acyl-CoA dehydrogenase family protein [Nocardia jiangxiensis]|uniref:acyl-CoA dehydrogenase family protein n=1 Tax=Nocardia jiangxiensis TaxID=282685 RepID=UPI0002E92340|nr:acyl-CoA dehydrogenase family protein [Nocardia jiangxiensis]
MTVETTTATSGLAELSARFADLFQRIADTAVERDARREVPHGLVRELGRAGFGALRVPPEYGGSGISMAELTELLLELAAADSNFPQILRAHFLYTESLLHAPDSELRTRWLRRIGAGDLLGGAYTERSTANASHFSTTVTHAGERRIVNGEKYYTTGSLYADWVITAGEGDHGVTHVIVAAGTPGLEIVDDWNGFGQRLTASGTTRFTEVDITETPQLPEDLTPGSYGTSLAQFWHIVALAGIARRLHTDVLAYVRDRKRYFSQGAAVLPRVDPVIQTVIGEIGSARFVAETLARRIGSQIGDLDLAVRAGSATEADFDTVEIDVYRAQVSVIDIVLAAAGRAFDVGGASALDATEGWDRHWRNARTLASHNPTPHRLVSIGDHDLNGTSPYRTWLSGIDLRNR